MSHPANEKFYEHQHEIAQEKKAKVARKIKPHDEKADDREVQRLVSRAMEKGKYRKY